MLDPLEWIHQVVQQIPAPRQHMVRYYGAYANRKRRRLCQKAESAGKSGTEMKVVSVNTEAAVIDRMLKHIGRTGGRDPFEGRGPPPGSPPEGEVTVAS